MHQHPGGRVKPGQGGHGLHQGAPVPQGPARDQAERPGFRGGSGAGLRRPAGRQSEQARHAGAAPLAGLPTPRPARPDRRSTPARPQRAGRRRRPRARSTRRDVQHGGGRHVVQLGGEMPGSAIGIERLEAAGRRDAGLPGGGTSTPVAGRVAGEDPRRLDVPVQRRDPGDLFPDLLEAGKAEVDAEAGRQLAGDHPVRPGRRRGP